MNWKGYGRKSLRLYQVTLPEYLRKISEILSGFQQIASPLLSIQLHLGPTCFEVGKVVRVKVMKVYEGSGGIAPRFLNLGTKLR
jgi:hypothetical protein